jgi:hypothetical protein
MKVMSDDIRLVAVSRRTFRVVTSAGWQARSTPARRQLTEARRRMPDALSRFATGAQRRTAREQQAGD